MKYFLVKIISAKLSSAYIFHILHGKMLVCIWISKKNITNLQFVQFILGRMNQKWLMVIFFVFSFISSYIFFRNKVLKCLGGFRGTDSEVALRSSSYP